jgi:hypothetical protein
MKHIHFVIIPNETISNLVIFAVVQVMVKIPSGKKIPVDAKTDDTIASIKEQLAEKEQISIGRQYLAHEGTKLEDEQTIEECGEERKVVPLDVSPGETIRNIKQQIKRKEGLVDDSYKIINIHLLDIYLYVCVYIFNFS